MRVQQKEQELIGESYTHPKSVQDKIKIKHLTRGSPV